MMSKIRFALNALGGLVVIGIVMVFSAHSKLVD